MGGVADKVKRCSRHETVVCAAMRVLAVPNDLGAWGGGCVHCNPGGVQWWPGDYWLWNNGRPLRTK